MYWSFLHYWSLNGDGSPLWIDAVCINREDLAERSAQVSLMKNIYSKAKKVVVSLGEGSPDIECAMKSLEVVSRLIRGGMKLDFDSGTRSWRLPRHEWQGWTGLRDLVNAPWFSRLWVM